MRPQTARPERGAFPVPPAGPFKAPLSRPQSREGGAMLMRQADSRAPDGGREEEEEEEVVEGNYKENEKFKSVAQAGPYEHKCYCLSSFRLINCTLGRPCPATEA